MRNHQGWPTGTCNDIRHHVGFSGACYTLQRLKSIATTQTLHELCNSRWLVSGRDEIRYKLEIHYPEPPMVNIHYRPFVLISQRVPNWIFTCCRLMGYNLQTNRCN